jgi:acetyl esterase
MRSSWPYKYLIYPLCDLTDALTTYQSAVDNAHAPILSTAYALDVAKLYAGQSDREDPELSPLRMSAFTDLAPALIQTAQYDPLRDQGGAYADRLRSAGIEVTHSNYRTVHAFIGIPGIARPARAAQHEVVEGIRRAFANLDSIARSDGTQTRLQPMPGRARRGC